MTHSTDAVIATFNAVTSELEMRKAKRQACRLSMADQFLVVDAARAAHRRLDARATEDATTYVLEALAAAANADDYRMTKSLVGRMGRAAQFAMVDSIRASRARLIGAGLMTAEDAR